VVGAAAIIDRSGGKQALDVPFHALATLSVPTYQPDSCPLCAAGIPVVKPGSRAQETGGAGAKSQIPNPKSR
jgi:orotate phosphoribosyltransferase